MLKGQEGIHVKTHYEFGNDPKKMFFKHKTGMKVDYRIKDMKGV
jgi:hypothetical protein